MKSIFFSFPRESDFFLFSLLMILFLKKLSIEIGCYFFCTDKCFSPFVRESEIFFFTYETFFPFIYGVERENFFFLFTESDFFSFSFIGDSFFFLFLRKSDVFL